MCEDTFPTTKKPAEKSPTEHRCGVEKGLWPWHVPQVSAALESA